MSDKGRWDRFTTNGYLFSFSDIHMDTVLVLLTASAHPLPLWDPGRAAGGYLKQYEHTLSSPDSHQQRIWFKNKLQPVGKVETLKSLCDTEGTLICPSDFNLKLCFSSNGFNF